MLMRFHTVQPYLPLLFLFTPLVIGGYSVLTSARLLLIGLSLLAWGGMSRRLLKPRCLTNVVMESRSMRAVAQLPSSSFGAIYGRF